jgi:D-hexose-6-phosphate mutarotase
MMNKFLFSAALAAAGFLSGCVSSPDASGVCVLENGYGRVEIALDGGRIESWRDAQGREVLFMPERPSSPGGEWSHGGIPPCWPWFGRVDGVIHGFARNKTFRVKRRGADSAVLAFTLAEGEEKSFPYAAELELSFSLGEKLSVGMTTANTGDESFTFSCGFHPYFRVGNYRAVKFLDVDEKPFACEDGMDKAFARRGEGTFAFADPSAARTVRARASGNSHVVVWTPGTVEPCNRNLLPYETERFVGYGPFVSKSERLTLKPGEKASLVLEISAGH